MLLFGVEENTWPFKIVCSNCVIVLMFLGTLTKMPSSVCHSVLLIIMLGMLVIVMS